MTVRPGSILLVVLLAVLVAPPLAAPAGIRGGPKHFATWDNLEADKLAAIWLLQTRLEPGAVVKLYPKGTATTAETQIDTPHAVIKRRFNRSAYEMLLQQYKVRDPRLINIGRLIHDIEINTWEAKLYTQTAAVQLYYLTLLREGLPPAEIMARSAAYLDVLYKTIPLNLQQERGRNQQTGENH